MPPSPPAPRLVAYSPNPRNPLAGRPASEWPALHAIVDVEVAERAGWTAVAYARALLDGGARFLQIRAKDLSSDPFLRLCDEMVAVAALYEATVIVNDRVDLAVMAGAAGVHVGQDDLGVADARRLLGEDAIVGYSTHTTGQIANGAGSVATYIAVGPVFGTTTKDTGYTAVGLDLVRLARQQTVRPVVAIGGVTLDNAAAALDAGATMVAVISDLLVGNDPAARVRAFTSRLGSR